MRRKLRDIAATRGLVGGPFGSSLVNSDYTGDGVPVIRGTNLSVGRYVGGEFAFVSAEKFDRDLVRNAAVARDVIYTQRGTLGQVALVPQTGPATYVVSQSQMRLRVDRSRAVPEFVYYASTTSDFVGQIQDRAIATGVPHTNLGILADLEIPLPALHEQQAIAEVLGALDDKIAANTALAAKAEEWVTAEVARVTTTTAPLGHFVELRKVQVDPTSLGDAEVDHFSLPAFDLDALPARESVSSIKSAKFLVESDVVLLSKLNPRFPRIWRASPESTRPALASTEFLVLEPRSISPALLWASLAQPSFSIHLDARVAGTSGSHQRVKPGDALTVEVLDPTLISRGLADAAEASLEIADGARAENRTLAAIRDALLPQLMSGKLRVRDAEIMAGEAGA